MGGKSDRKFYTKAGWLTPYGLACGYIEECEPRPGVRLQLWQEHGALHVRAHDHNNHERLFWDCPETLTEARARYSRAKHELKVGK